jgi:hypothetical protein
LDEQNTIRQQEFEDAMTHFNTRLKATADQQVQVVRQKCATTVATALRERDTAEARYQAAAATQKDLQTRYDVTKRQLENRTDNTSKHTQTEDTKTYNACSQCDSP